MRLTYAGVLEQKADYEAAIAEYEKLLKQDPGSLIVANNLASLLSDRRSDKASLERAYSVAAVLRKSQVPPFQDTLGWIEYLRGDYKSATGLLEEAALALPQRAIAQYHLGMSYVANRYPHVRAAVAWSPEVAELARRHNDANVLALPARFLSEDDARKILQTWLDTPFQGLEAVNSAPGDRGLPGVARGL